MRRALEAMPTDKPLADQPDSYEDLVWVGEGKGAWIMEEEPRVDNRSARQRATQWCFTGLMGIVGLCLVIGTTCLAVSATMDLQSWMTSLGTAPSGVPRPTPMHTGPLPVPQQEAFLAKRVAQGSPLPQQVLRGSLAPERAALAAPTSVPMAAPVPYMCALTHGGGADAWSKDKRRWCCTNRLVGCSVPVPEGPQV
eukprot:CAMPEP_0195058458 /NCGR_PEP_ID=MMETSP0448-20130528/6301_1 /TAXON_ID=66468 /ORGANISM="Heterocapsa triquestra, Strain CCMP 448" /LENGTH=195 /DNA_ID=CAMNT_0040088611 /DNA_START=38 /DNA_END=625 /DNA_ORIENTATION=+